MKKQFFCVLSCLTLLCVNGKVNAQFTLSGEIRPRTEFRDGYGTLPDETTNPAFFVGQRSRLVADFQKEKFTTRFSVQDVRTWGNYSLYNDGAAATVYEAWVKYNFTDKWGIKVGRQAVKYDDQRLLASRNWSTKGASHDLALLQFSDAEKNMEMDAAFGVNNQGEDKFMEPYTLNYYKYLAYVWFSKKLNDHVKFSFIVLSDANESANDSSLVYLRTTLGPNVYVTSGKFEAGGTFYYQGGKLKTGKDVKANLFAITTTYKPGDHVTLTAGYDHYSGTDLSDTEKSAKESNAFSRVYGSGHKFLGDMDYFTDADTHSKGAGINDLYASATYGFSPKTKVGATLHMLSLDKEYISATQKADKKLGTELDFTFVYKPGRMFDLMAGYCMMFQTETLEALQGFAAGSTGFPSYAYVMVTFNPVFFTDKK